MIIYANIQTIWGHVESPGFSASIKNPLIRVPYQLINITSFSGNARTVSVLNVSHVTHHLASRFSTEYNCNFVLESLLPNQLFIWDLVSGIGHGLPEPHGEPRLKGYHQGQQPYWSQTKRTPTAATTSCGTSKESIP